MKKPIFCFDLKAQHLHLKDELRAAMDRVFEQSAFSSGPFVTEFENGFARFCSVRKAVGVNSGTSALHLCLLALGIGEGDEVILPANTFIATAWAPCYVGAKPVLVDCDGGSWNIDAAQIEAKITPRTRAILGVHLYGQPFDFGAVKKIAENHGLFVIEDCAQAHGATYRNRVVGGLGDIAAFSFYPNKNLGACGEGGAVTSDTEAYIDRIRMLINHGSVQKHHHELIGYNMRMDGLQGAVLNVKLKYLASWNRRRQEIARRYREGIRNPRIQSQCQLEGTESVYHLYVITTEHRDDLMRQLNEDNIFPGLHYPVPIHLQRAFAHLRHHRGDFENAEYLADHCLSLPMYPELPDEDVARVIEQINRF